MSETSTTYRAKVIVGIDGSEAATHALEWALAEARLHATTLEVIHVWAPPVPISALGARLNPIDPALYEHAANATLEEARRVLPTRDPETAVHVDHHLIRGHAATVLLERSKEAGLLVVGSRGRGGFVGLLVGSVSQHCAEHATRPVAVIRPSVSTATGGGVVVGVDGSGGSWRALRWAFDEAALRNTRLSVVHAWSMPTVVEPSVLVTLPPWSRDYAAHSVDLLHEMVDGMVGRGPQPSSIDLLPIEDRAARALLHCSRDAELLVVGSRGRGGFAGLLLGSVSHQCLHHAGCPIVIVPDPSRLH